MAESLIIDDDQAEGGAALASDLGPDYETLKDLTRGALDSLIDLRRALPESPFSMSGVQLRLLSNINQARACLDQVALTLATEVYQP